jgi:hypothetical protein
MVVEKRQKGYRNVIPSYEQDAADGVHRGRAMPGSLRKRLRALEGTTTSSVAPPATPPDSEAVSDFAGPVGERRRVRPRHRSPSFEDSDARN